MICAINSYQIAMWRLAACYVLWWERPVSKGSHKLQGQVKLRCRGAVFHYLAVFSFLYVLKYIPHFKRALIQLGIFFFFFFLIGQPTTFGNASKSFVGWFIFFGGLFSPKGTWYYSCHPLPQVFPALITLLGNLWHAEAVRCKKSLRWVWEWGKNN